LKIGLPKKLGDILHNDIHQRGLQEKIRNAFGSCIQENAWGKARNAFSHDDPWDFFLRDVTEIIRFSGWDTLAYLAGETMRETMITVVALTISGEHEKAKKVAELLDFFVMGHPFVDELRENYFIMLEE
jgi:hypothetical protein